MPDPWARAAAVSGQLVPICQAVMFNPLVTCAPVAASRSRSPNTPRSTRRSKGTYTISTAPVSLTRSPSRHLTHGRFTTPYSSSRFKTGTPSAVATSDSMRIVRAMYGADSR
jgi:hypothetical protein